VFCKECGQAVPDGARLIVYPGAPHGITDTHKDRLNQDLLDFLKENGDVAHPGLNVVRCGKDGQLLVVRNGFVEDEGRVGQPPFAGCLPHARERILDAGGTIAGKVHCEYFCFSGGSHTSAAGPVQNPRKPGYSAGGSSSGSAAVRAVSLWPAAPAPGGGGRRAAAGAGRGGGVVEGGTNPNQPIPG
jgi:hypothetical protein